MNSPTIKYDVAVVGAGPSGSTAARLLAEAGLQVVILDKAPWPRNKTCGGGLVARARKELPEDIKLPVQHECYNACINLNDAGLSYTATRSEPIVSMVMRTDLDEVLVDAAVKKGADFRDEFHISRMQNNGSTLSIGSSSDSLHVSMVIAADGVNSTVAKLNNFPDGRILAPAIEWEVPMEDADIDRFSNIARFDFGVLNDGYAWIFPKANHLSVGLGTMRARSRNLPAVLSRYLKNHDIPFERTLSRKGHLIPLSTRKGMLCQGRVLLVGDAAGFVDPVTAEGLTFALKSGSLAAEAIIAGQGDHSQVASLYQDKLQQFLLPEMRYGRWLATLLYRLPTWRNRIFKSHGQRLVERMADLVMGDLAYHDVLRRRRFWTRILGLH